MADRSSIQWTEATWNPTTGCTKVSPGCARCYIERTPPFRIAGRRFERGRIPLQFHPDRLETPLRWRKPRRVFVNSLSDLFHQDIPDELIDRVFAVMAFCGQHQFQLLTKRADRMHAYVAGLAKSSARLENACPTGYALRWEGISLCPWPLPNVWLGVSVENQHFADERIPFLLRTPAAVRFLSCEPLIGPVDLTATGAFYCHDHWTACGPSCDGKPRIGWVIVGGESGPNPRMCDLEWVRSLRDQCSAARVPCFVKQLGAKAVGLWSRPGETADGPFTFRLRDSKGGDITEWPTDLRVRQYPLTA